MGLLRAYRNQGILINLRNEYQRFALENGRTETSLSAMERQQILLNAVLRQGVNTFGAYEAAMNDVYKQWTSMERLELEAKKELGNQFQGLFRVYVENASGFLESFTKWSDGAKATTAAMAAAIPVALGLAGALSGLRLVVAGLGGPWAWGIGGATLAISALAGAVVNAEADAENVRRRIKEAGDESAAHIAKMAQLHGIAGDLQAYSKMTDLSAESTARLGERIDDARRLLPELRDDLRGVTDAATAYTAVANRMGEKGWNPQRSILENGKGDVAKLSNMYASQLQNVENAITEAIDKRKDGTGNLEYLTDGIVAYTSNTERDKIGNRIKSAIKQSDEYLATLTDEQLKRIAKYEEKIKKEGGQVYQRGTPEYSAKIRSDVESGKGTPFGIDEETYFNWANRERSVSPVVNETRETGERLRRTEKSVTSEENSAQLRELDALSRRLENAGEASDRAKKRLEELQQKTIHSKITKDQDELSDMARRLSGLRMTPEQIERKKTLDLAKLDEELKTHREGRYAEIEQRYRGKTGDPKKKDEEVSKDEQDARAGLAAEKKKVDADLEEGGSKRRKQVFADYKTDLDNLEKSKKSGEDWRKLQEEQLTNLREENELTEKLNQLRITGRFTGVTEEEVKHQGALVKLEEQYANTLADLATKKETAQKELAAKTKQYDNEVNAEKKVSLEAKIKDKRDELRGITDRIASTEKQHVLDRESWVQKEAQIQSTAAQNHQRAAKETYDTAKKLHEEILALQYDETAKTAAEAQKRREERRKEFEGVQDFIRSERAAIADRSVPGTSGVMRSYEQFLGEIHKAQDPGQLSELQSLFGSRMQLAGQDRQEKMASLRGQMSNAVRTGKPDEYYKAQAELVTLQRQGFQLSQFEREAQRGIGQAVAERSKKLKEIAVQREQERALLVNEIQLKQKDLEFTTQRLELEKKIFALKSASADKAEEAALREREAALNKDMDLREYETVQKEKAALRQKYEGADWEELPGLNKQFAALESREQTALRGRKPEDADKLKPRYDELKTAREQLALERQQRALLWERINVPIGGLAPINPQQTATPQTQQVHPQTTPQATNAPAVAVPQATVAPVAAVVAPQAGTVAQQVTPQPVQTKVPSVGQQLTRMSGPAQFKVGTLDASGKVVPEIIPSDPLRHIGGMPSIRDIRDFGEQGPRGMPHVSNGRLDLGAIGRKELKRKPGETNEAYNTRLQQNMANVRDQSRLEMLQEKDLEGNDLTPDQKRRNLYGLDKQLKRQAFDSRREALAGGFEENKKSRQRYGELLRSGATPDEARSIIAQGFAQKQPMLDSGLIKAPLDSMDRMHKSMDRANVGIKDGFTAMKAKVDSMTDTQTDMAEWMQRFDKDMKANVSDAQTAVRGLRG